MQMGQEKFGMQTFNQSLANLYFRKLVSLDTVMAMTSFPEELTDIIQRREGAKTTSGGAAGSQKR
jgi:twitching motility protein PilT